ncbi:MutS-related protein [Christiangramia flava]|uniref:MutS-related protein, family 1 n=1 Tax=Christiangramia flava JLT2011 TaxID=1229726 RepID=A0A1L7I4M4_9FLAO|nr:DNA mismatch repair protein MutS [Christiangramia flava]APU68560.1 MutS-related protein, family 1 [Christiangramia flava JLT2011]OSS40653.1 MutS-related protein, family 1 [Christiangramia flava JLT2011]
MNDSALAFYKDRLQKHQQTASRLKSRLGASSLMRLAIFLAACGTVYVLWGNFQLMLPILVVLTAIFLFLLSRHTDLKRERDKFLELIQLNQTEIHILETGDFSKLPDGKKLEPAMHPFSRDIDLFGKKSFFQYLNRTSLKEGREKLAYKLLSNDTASIPEKQECIKELSQKTDWRQEFLATARLVKTETKSTTITHWIREYQSFIPKYATWLVPVFSLISLAVILAWYLDYIGFMQLLLWLFIGIGITAFRIKKVTALSGDLAKVEDIFQQYHRLLGLIESENFESAYLQKIQRSIRSEKSKASHIVRQFSKAIDALDQRNNFLFGFPANGFFLWDLQKSYAIEKLIEENRDSMGAWFEAVEETDALISLGNFAFNHADYAFPKIIDEPVIRAKNLGHPLIASEKRISNDFEIKNGNFFIITGANMAGKSTFLRTVALQILMANTGLPVCAESCKYSPIKLITSMRTSDSLGDDESYFFSELKRLKYIVDTISKDRYFIILDEILKGTNSTDKAIGSQKFVERLVETNSTGIIATHDLSLCELSENLGAVENYYFDAEIVNDELHFDYLLKTGVCQNMNASFLLRKMKIVRD